ncbi:Prefoldin subunit 3 [Vanrija pseudolonga]|uniref:Prefoldin subunit 3 n=1 Tax=Vanrija pseudolonga TaxID=143232 RepID=A0AAF0YCM2_9TREE|nr:Prefoldin subunit 3 [Vanrija pseudolonga]
MASASSSKRMELNPRGIPRAPFVDNVEEYVGGKDADVESVIKKFQETSAKYRYMELNLQQRRKALLAKIPDIEQTLSVVNFLAARRRKAAGEAEPEEDEAKDSDDELDDLLDGDEDEDKKDEPLTTLFELNDTLFAQAQVNETGEVGLWLGANTMLMYPLAEASELLSGKLSSAKKSLADAVEDLEWIREQVTVMEVNFARVHNWDVKRRRDRREQESLLTGGKDDESDKE